ncbi:putative RNA-binding protein [Ordospora colligata]|uniref:Putative RNA-binding protein n=1 Tax=Ordospora colligata OC4 TaxID=1354746 RepID=A0A0B2UMP7_9MICR|nr:putative RNA-binding protein [Ordospora colligata OC4]KHN70230.1 putative RNA-binding protein [Ordospora colligata OC4]TBU16774.1 putative RNA-binding protein [Ordospora colligata]TBU17080.1 putative RNA-binding protein [Ordospora colligata]TBU19323.1 putative RNA-binding protein [Ordospora colligata]
MNKLFVSNFPECYLEKDIELIFTPFGDIKSIKVVKEPRVFAIVEFRTSQECVAAIESIRGRRLYGCTDTLQVEPAFDRKRRVVVSGIPLGTHQHEISDFFKYYGTIENATQNNDGLVIVDYSLQKDAEYLLTLEGKVSFNHNTTKLSIKPFLKKEKTDRVISHERSIFVYNLPAKMTNTDLRESFEKFGCIFSCGVLSGGKGFVNYDRELSALKAIRHMDGKKISGKKARVVLKSMKKEFSSN